MDNDYCIFQRHDGEFVCTKTDNPYIKEYKILETGTCLDMTVRAEELNQIPMPCVYSVGQMYISTARNEIISIYRIVEIIETHPNEWEARQARYKRSMSQRFIIKGELILSNFRKPKNKRKEALYPSEVGKLITKEWIQEKVGFLKELESYL